MNIIDKYTKNSVKIYLKEIKFENNPSLEKKDSYLECYDELNAQLKGEDVIEVNFIRHVTILPQESSDLKIVIGAEFIINTKKIKVKEIQWKEIDFVNEFKESNIMDDVGSRASLLVAQITSIFSKNPLITPPGFLEREN